MRLRISAQPYESRTQRKNAARVENRLFGADIRMSLKSAAIAIFDWLRTLLTSYPFIFIKIPVALILRPAATSSPRSLCVMLPSKRAAASIDACVPQSRDVSALHLCALTRDKIKFAAVLSSCGDCQRFIIDINTVGFLLKNNFLLK